MKRILLSGLTALALATGAHGANKLGVVVYNGYPGQIQPTDTMLVPSLLDSGLSTSLYVCTNGSLLLVSCSGGGLPSLASGTLLGNSGASSAIAAQTTLTALIDRALGSTQGDVLYRGASAWTVLTPGSSGQCLQTQGASANPQWGACGVPSTNQNTRTISWTIGGLGTPITSGVSGYLRIFSSCTLGEVTLIADQTGSITVDIWKTSYVPNTPPTSGNTITASDIPAIASGQTYDDTSLTGWTTAVTAGDVIAYDAKTVDGVLTQVTVALKCVTTS